MTGTVDWQYCTVSYANSESRIFSLPDSPVYGPCWLRIPSQNFHTRPCFVVCCIVPDPSFILFIFSSNSSSRRSPIQNLQRISLCFDIFPSVVAFFPRYPTVLFPNCFSKCFFFPLITSSSEEAVFSSICSTSFAVSLNSYLLTTVNCITHCNDIF